MLAHRFDHFGQKLAGGTDEELSTAIFICARTFTDEREQRRRAAFAKDQLIPAMTELAAATVSDELTDDAQSLGPTWQRR